ncbi:MAG: ASKHA domain-containing protein [bacterium]
MDALNPSSGFHDSPAAAAAGECRVTFEPGGRAVRVLAGTLLIEAAARAGLIVQTPCGGKGTCGKCAVRVTTGECPPSAACAAQFSPARLKAGWRLACQARIMAGDAMVEIPEKSMFDRRSKILTTGSRNRKVAFKPTVWKQYVELPVPTQADDLPDLQRLERAVGQPLHAALPVLRLLPDRLRQERFAGTAVICGERLLDFEPGNSSLSCFGAAFDLGTTTIVGMLVNLYDGCEVAVSATLNPQVALGDDVISRIARVRDNPSALEELRAAVIQTVNHLLQDLIEQAGMNPELIYEVTVAGNTTMQQLFCGVSPAALGEVPFPAGCRRALMFEAQEVGLVTANPRARLYVFPIIGGFVGGDTVAGLLATDLAASSAPTLLVDIGTNGELVLAHAGKLFACSTAAGPAFEGARISAGMRATEGAIEKIVLADGDLCFNVIGDSRPAGLCGTALIDVVAELLRLGVIEDTGRLLPPDDLPPDVPAAIRARLRTTERQTDFLLVPATVSRTGEPLWLRQRDVRELQLATAAIRAGIIILLRQAGLTPDQLETVLLAGGFGNFIRRNNARRIGLLPAIPSERIRFVGNTSLMGARDVLISKEERVKAEALAARTQHLDLSLAPEFQAEFSNAMLFPDGDGHDPATG